MLRFLFSTVLIASVVSVDEYWRLPIPPQGQTLGSYPPLARQLTPQSCGLCHPKQYQEWQTSLHASAVSEGLVGQLPAFDEDTQAACLSCHAPRSEQLTLWQSQGLEAMTDLHGVDCAACHVRSHRRFSSQEKPSTPHGSVKRLALFEKAEFCAPCHQFDADGESLNGKLLENTYEEWRTSPYASAGKSCQHCHMPEKSHEFKGIHDPEMTRRGLKIQARRTDSGIWLRARNAGAGHALPTYATPKISIVMQAKDKPDHRHEHIIQRRLTWDEDHGWKELFDTRLLPNQPLELRLNLEPNQRASITVTVIPDAYYHEQVYPALIRLIGDELEPEARKLLDQAHRTSGQTGYVLDQLQCDSWTGQESPCTE